MIYLFMWILFIPILYVAYYSDLINGELGRYSNTIIISPNENNRHRIRAFLYAVSGPVGLGIYLTCCLLALLMIILKTGQLGNPVNIFPLHNPWKD